MQIRKDTKSLFRNLRSFSRLTTIKQRGPNKEMKKSFRNLMGRSTLGKTIICSVLKKPVEA